MSTFSSPSAAMPLKSIDPNDCNVPNAGTDGISSLCWSPTANILVSCNWDSTVSCWEVQEQGGRIQANPKAQSKIL
jgi:mRNA export factor